MLLTFTEATLTLIPDTSSSASSASAAALFCRRPGEDGGVDDAVLILQRWRPAGSLSPLLPAQWGIMDGVLCHSRTLRGVPLCSHTGDRWQVHVGGENWPEFSERIGCWYLSVCGTAYTAEAPPLPALVRLQRKIPSEYVAFCLFDVDFVRSEGLVVI